MDYGRLVLTALNVIAVEIAPFIKGVVEESAVRIACS